MYADEELRGPELVAVRIHETETGWAQYTEYLVENDDILDVVARATHIDDETEKEEEK